MVGSYIFQRPKYWSFLKFGWLSALPPSPPSNSIFSWLNCLLFHRIVLSVWFLFQNTFWNDTGVATERFCTFQTSKFHVALLLAKYRKVFKENNFSPSKKVFENFIISVFCQEKRFLPNFKIRAHHKSVEKDICVKAESFSGGSVIYPEILPKRRKIQRKHFCTVLLFWGFTVIMLF